MVLGLSMLQHFWLNNYNGFQLLKLSLLLITVLAGVSAFIFGYFGDLNQRKLRLSLIVDIAVGLITAAAGLMMFFTSIDLTDLYTLKTKNIVEVTALTNDYKLKLDSGKVIYADKSDVDISKSKNDISYGTVLVEQKRAGITDRDVKVFNDHTDDLWNNALRLKLEDVSKPRIVLSKSDQSRFANLKYKQTMKLEP